MLFQIVTQNYPISIQKMNNYVLIIIKILDGRLLRLFGVGLKNPVLAIQ
jgi:hypothetical protein